MEPLSVAGGGLALGFLLFVAMAIGFLVLALTGRLGIDVRLFRTIVAAIVASALILFALSSVLGLLATLRF